MLPASNGHIRTHPGNISPHSQISPKHQNDITKAILRGSACEWQQGRVYHWKTLTGIFSTSAYVNNAELKPRHVITTCQIRRQYNNADGNVVHDKISTHQICYALIKRSCSAVLLTDLCWLTCLFWRLNLSLEFIFICGKASTRLYKIYI